MIMNQAALGAIFTAFRTLFNEAFGGVETQYSRVAMTVPSTTLENTYDWLGNVPQLREWLGDRVVQNLAAHGYTIKNRKFELTIGVDRSQIEDDQIGVFNPLIADMGRSAAEHPDLLAWSLLSTGFTATCYDGQFFFDTDHPVLDAAGAPQSVSNTQGGAGTPWFLMDGTRAVKPLIWQPRRPYEFTRLDAPDDQNVFMRGQYLYGVDARANVGFGLWQLAYGSKQTLDAANYAAMRAAMLGMKGDYDRPLGVRPSLLVVPPSLEGDARAILMNERDANGATPNKWRNTAELLVVPWLA